ncbi:tetratricopeptide repeat protein [Ramlibacter sp. USB13]|uniref:protein O-GlcNAc transferase n=1 Tax=Ramlibacter cellulosilyticus TaxID=2764187 RepID=A0A923MPK2_9BURK|nr:tetratricopeptide repeat protein [Ramlibacter cellulosilyticus]MBC5782556.1 tetratricopeptide repeat protein [Ramlibacter cellulosilyticus]
MLAKLFSFWRGEDAAGPLALYHAGDTEQAERAANERLASAANDRDALLTQAFLLADRGRGKDAAAIAERVLATNPRDAQAWLAIARAHSMAGRRKPASEALQAALLRDGNDATILADVALLALAEGQVETAAHHLSRARGNGRRLGVAHRELAAILLQRGQLQAGERELEHAIAADPRDALAHANLGALRKDLGRRDEAARSFERALELMPQLSEAAYNLAMLRIDAKDWPAAATLLRTYLAQQPRDAEAQYWLGNALMGQGDAQAARAAYEAAVRIDSHHERARWGLAMAQLPAIPMTVEEQQQGVLAFGEQVRKLRAWCRTHAKGDAWQAVGAQQPFFLAYVEENHAEALHEYGSLCVELMEGWARKVKVPKPAVRRAGAKLRVGIVSGHIQRHSVWDAVLRGWVAHLDPARFELHLFHTGGVQDAETRWAAGHVERVVQGLGDWTAWAKAVSDTQCDVVIYPEIGMDATTVRLASLRLARVQLAGWGHPLTTGLPTIDGYLSAEAFEPEGAQQHYTERLHALPRLGCAYRPYGTKPQAPDLSAWNIAPSDRLLVAPGVAFKYGPRDDALWVDIARRCAPCKLVFFSGNDAHARRLQQRLRDAFASAGVDYDASVRFLPWQPQPAFFALLQRAEVFLDTVGFSGFNTAMQAVECGTPIVAWEGRFMRGRFASAILRSLGLQAWVANSHEAYAEKVQQLCEDAELRAKVKAKIAAGRDALYEDKGSVDALATLLEKLAG